MKNGFGVSLTTYQLSNRNHHNSSDLTFHVYEMGIINLSSKDYHKHKVKLLCFSSHRGISGVVEDVSEGLLNTGNWKTGFPTHLKHS